jgi:hypothetical protein
MDNLGAYEKLVADANFHEENSHGKSFAPQTGKKIFSP